MPVYLCKPGWGTAEPWKHGVPVFAHPFPTNDKPTARSDLPSGVDDASSSTNAQSGSANRSFYTRPVPSFTAQRQEEFCAPVRRVRHSEVVLVDEVSVHYNKYWLRLRWPGSRGGVAGYILLGGTNSVPNDRAQEWKDKLKGAVGGIEDYKQTLGNHSGSIGDLHVPNEEGENHMFLDNANFGFVFSHCTLTTQTTKMISMTRMYTKTILMILIMNPCKGILPCAVEVPVVRRTLLRAVSRLVYISLQQQQWNC